MATRQKKQARRERRKLNRAIEAAQTPTEFRILEASGENDYQIEAAESGESETKLRKFSMTAYTGGKMMLRGFPYPVIVDLSGVKVSGKSRPILRDHNPERIVGHTTEITIANSIKLKGILSAANQYAGEVQASSDNGFPWQSSIGAAPNRMVFLDRGETTEVNGKKVTGPAYIARQSTLREISFVALGADDNTSSRLEGGDSTPSTIEAHTMKFEQWLQAKGFDPNQISDAQRTSLQAMFDAEQADKKPDDKKPNPEQKPDKTPITASASDDGIPDPITELRATYTAERKRINAITRICKNHPEIEAKAIDEEWDETKAELEVMRASRSEGPTTLIRTDPQITDQVLEASVCMSLGLDSEKLEASYNEQTLDAAHKQFRGRIGLQQLLMEAAWQNGYQGRNFRADMRGVLQAAFSTTSIPGILSNTANKFLLMGFETVESTWRMISARRSVQDFKQITNYRLTGNFEYEELGPGGEIKHGKVNEESYTNQADTYAKMFAITRSMIINDDLGALEAVPRRLGRGAALKINKVFWAEFLDNSTFFKSANNNYFDGATSALDVDSLTTAEQKFFDQTDPDGDPLGVNPAILLVPNGLNVVGSNLMASAELRPDGNSSAKKVMTKNPHAGKFTVERSSYLANANYDGYSALAWYLLASPEDLPVIEVCFLNGQEMPTIETADADFNQLGIQMRGYHDFGVNKQEHRGGVKSKGEA